MVTSSGNREQQSSVRERQHGSERPEAIDAARNGDRPSRHGAMLGEVLALLADLGRHDSPMPIPDACLTCAFRRGTMPNQAAGTGKIALDCVLGIDRDRFACHHGMKAGEPQKICVGYIAARLAPFSKVKEILSAFHDELALLGDDPDEVRAAFDAWIDRADPARKMDVYEAARVYAKHVRTADATGKAGD